LILADESFFRSHSRGQFSFGEVSYIFGGASSILAKSILVEERWALERTSEQTNRRKSEPETAGNFGADRFNKAKSLFVSAPFFLWP
jgi:hypothetical protein